MVRRPRRHLGSMVFVLLGLTVSGALPICRQALRPATCPSFISAVTSASTRTFASRGSSSDCNGVLDEVEVTLSKVFSGGITPQTNVVTLPAGQREAAGVAINIRKRLDALARNNDCPRCWLQRKHCVCDQCPPCDNIPKVNRLFLLTHHKEVGLVVDTAKLLLSSFPETSRLVVAGIGREYQVSMGELLDAMSGENARNCIVLFPSDDARTFHEIESGTNVEKDKFKSTAIDNWDVVVIDGTWQQARKLYNRYIPSEQDGGPWRVQLSREAVAILNGDNEPNDGPGKIPGHQLRRHPIRWREVSTLEATRLLLRDMMGNDDPPSEISISDIKPWDSLAVYQRIADEAAQRQLGPPRLS